MKSLIQTLFGLYTPKFDTITEKVWNVATNSFETVINTVTVNGIAGLDWEWIAGVVLFGLTMYSILRIIGGVICGRF